MNDVVKNLIKKLFSRSGTKNQRLLLGFFEYKVLCAVKLLSNLGYTRNR